MVFGLWGRTGTGQAISLFQFPVGIRWCSDGGNPGDEGSGGGTFNSLWELDGVRTSAKWEDCLGNPQYFNSPWELDGVRTVKTLVVADAVNILSIPCGN